MPAELDDYLCEIQCEEFYGDDPENDEEEEEWSDRDSLPDSDEDSILIDENGGLTAEGYEMLAQLDAAGYFV